MNLSDARRFRRSSDPRVRDEAERTLAADKARKTRTRPKRAERIAKKRATREEGNQRTAEIREACVRRADGRGELCGEPFSDLYPAEMCHLDGGNGKRRQQQSERNCLMEHHLCHQGAGGLDRVPTVWLPFVKEWAQRHGYPLPERFRKLEALRAPEAAR